jgi:hypothetical protein
MAQCWQELYQTTTRDATLGNAPNRNFVSSYRDKKHGAQQLPIVAGLTRYGLAVDE